ncbi:MAG TPA: PIG-L family deacetylase [Planctomycetes bacterium]|nr:PIG-L family deacetylase [Planctomycetota bacterium]
MSEFYRRWEPLFDPRDLANGALLVLAPHPDDEVIGCGGLILAHRVKEQPVTVAVATDGRLGITGGAGDDDYVKLRTDEHLEAGRVLGGTESLFLGFPDGGLAEALSTGALTSALVELLDSRAWRTVVFSSPFELHPDHRALGLATLEALKTARVPQTILAMEIGSFMPANLLIDVTPYAEDKDRAMMCYASQLEHHDILGKLRGVDVARSANVPDRAVKRCEAYLRIRPERIPDYVSQSGALLRLVDEMMPPVPWENS